MNCLMVWISVYKSPVSHALVMELALLFTSIIMIKSFVLKFVRMQRWVFLPLIRFVNKQLRRWRTHVLMLREEKPRRASRAL